MIVEEPVLGDGREDVRDGREDVLKIVFRSKSSQVLLKLDRHCECKLPLLFFAYVGLMTPFIQWPPE